MSSTTQPTYYQIAFHIIILHTSALEPQWKFSKDKEREYKMHLSEPADNIPPSQMACCLID